MVSFHPLRLFALAAVLMPAATAAATICHVAPEGNGSGNSWASPMALQTALAHANCIEIWMRKGVYKPVVPAGTYPTTAERKISFAIRPGSRIYGGFSGNELLRDERNPAQYRSVLSGDLDNDDSVDADGIVNDAVNGNRNNNSYHVVTMDGTTGEGAITHTTVLDGLVITSGRANGASAEQLNLGGGLYCRAVSSGHECNPTLRNVLFAGNVASHGGAMYHRGNTGGISSPFLQQVEFRNNNATSHGGAIYIDGSDAGNTHPEMREVRFIGNRASNHGGAIFIDAESGNARPLVHETQFSGNTASYGGAVYSDAHNNGTGRASFSNVTFHGNTASTDGGAIYNYAGNNGNAWLSISFSTFSGNSAGRGGAIANAGNTGNPGITGQLVFNSILWGNTANGAGSQIHNHGAQPLIRSSIVGGGCPAGAECVGEIDANPMLGSLADNGGWSWTMLPGTDSPARDAAYYDSYDSCPSTDQRGVPRVQGSNCDLGAVEVEVPPCYVKHDAGGSNNGTSWTNAYTRLQSALGNSNCGEIRVARGVYTPTDSTDRTISFNIRARQRVYGGFNGTETHLAQRNPGLNRTVLSGDIDRNDNTDADGILLKTSDRIGNNSHRIVMLDATGASAMIAGSTVLDGFVITGAGDDAHGAGLLCRASGNGRVCNPTLRNLLFSANAGDAGGGMLLNGSNGGMANPTLTNVTFRSNSAWAGAGALENNGSNNGQASPVLTNVTFEGNWITAVVNNGNNNGISSPVLTNVTFVNNRNRWAGASMLSHADGGTSQPLLTNVIMWGGTASDPDEDNCLGNNHPEMCNINAIPLIEASIIAGGCPTGAICGTGLISADPKLDPLNWNGGATPTAMPGADGAAIDAGNDEFCAHHDQRGVSRPQGAGCDIGAVERTGVDVGGGGNAGILFADGFESG
ncbi:hypothetical protein OS187_00255 [Xanthomonadaceae bacterium JHOS43]|nr:hypothetical protein [Xanthomonadaceae bacterium JHOS43]